MALGLEGLLDGRPLPLEAHGQASGCRTRRKIWGGVMRENGEGADRNNRRGGTVRVGWLEKGARGGGSERCGWDG